MALKVFQFVKGSERYGASVSIRNLCFELKKRGHEVTVVAFKGWNLGPEIEAGGIRAIETRSFYKFDPRAYRFMKRLFRAERPDIVHTHLSAATLIGSLSARMAGIPSVSTVHGMNRKWTYLFAEHLIAVSEAGKQNLVDQGISSKRVSVAYNGIHIPPAPSPADRTAARQALGITNGAPVLGTLSRADYGKGIQDAIDSIAILRRRRPDIKYVFAGEGAWLPELKDQTRALGLESNVLFLGYRNDVQAVLSAMDVFLFPSLKEAMGISIVEAMAMAIPVVGTVEGGIPEVVDEASGILVGKRQPFELASACESLLADEGKRRAFGANARKRAETCFSLSASADAVEAIYRKVISARS